MKLVVRIFVFCLSAMLLIMMGCAQPNDPDSQTDGVDYLELEAFYESEGYVLDFDVSDNYVYMAEDEAGFSIHDNINSNLIIRTRKYSPDSLSTYILTNVRLIAADEGSNTMLIYNRYGGTTSGLHIYDISDINNPERKYQHFGTSDDINSLQITAVDSMRLRFSWINGENSYFSGQFGKYPNNAGYYLIPEADNVFDFDIAEIDDHYEANRLYFASKQLGMIAVDKSDYSILTTISTIGQTLSVKVVDNIAYIGNREEGIMVADISDPANPIELYNYDTTGLASDIAVNPALNIFALASTSGGVYLFNGSQGEIKRLQRIYQSEIGYTYKVKFHGSHLYVATRYGVYKYAIVNL